jgi:hypothetical protein
MGGARGAGERVVPESIMHSLPSEGIYVDRAASLRLLVVPRRSRKGTVSCILALAIPLDLWITLLIDRES